MGTEQVRISRMLETARQCNASVALAKAQAFYGSAPCRPGACVRSTTNTQTQTSGQYLKGKMDSCVPIVRFSSVPESTRIARLMTSIHDAETDPTNPTTRFKAYTRVFPIQCPPIDQAIANGNEPKASTRCQLPNTPFNPVLPA